MDTNQIIENYHQKVLSHLKKLKLDNILKNKNTYLAGSEGIQTAQDYVRWCLDSWFISSKETKFGSQVMEELALNIAAQCNGNIKKSNLNGIDFEIATNTTIDLVQNKSGSKWGNADQLNRMSQNFQEAKLKYLSNNPNEIREIRFINGCCYGKDNGTKSTKYGSYIKMCGQEYWEYLTGDDQFYIKLIDPIIKNNKSEELNNEYAKIINAFTASFIKDYCKEDYSINWEALLKLSSGKKNLK